MSPGTKVELVIINSGVIVQHMPPVNIVKMGGTSQEQPQSIAVHKESFQELSDYLEGLNLFEACKN